MYEFQSLHRNHDLSNGVSFKNYTYITADEEKAKYVREVCKKNPNTMWEITKEIREGKAEVNPIIEAQKKRGRPKVIRGFRGSDVAEGASI